MTEMPGKNAIRLNFKPRILYLCRRADRMREQFEGRQMSWAQARSDGPDLLRDDVSTDEISPLPAMVHFDATLGRYPYTGFKAGDTLPIGRDAIVDGGFEVVVAGGRYGKGSSREHSVVAELSAGVRLVIARSFERIYRQNADNLGLYTSTDFGLLDRIERGESIDLEALLRDRDALAAAILSHGGLLKYGQAWLRSARPGPIGADGGTASSEAVASTPMTLFHKIVVRHLSRKRRAAPSLLDPRGGLAGRSPGLGALLVTENGSGAEGEMGYAGMPLPGEGAFVRADYRFIHEYYTGMCAHLLEKAFGESVVLVDPGSILTFEDHLSYVHRSPVHVDGGLIGNVQALSRAHRTFAARHGLAEHGYLQPLLEAGDPGNTGSQGISHALMAEKYALPGQLIVGTDSHTPHSGALGCVAFGVGTTDMANAFVTGAVRMTMPTVLRVELNGVLPRGVTAKDLALHLLAEPAIRAGAGVGKVFEFGGPVVKCLGIDERATLTNMTAELGGFTGMVEPDLETVRFLRERRGIHIELQPWMSSDPGAPYDDVIRIDCTDLSPIVARPGDPGNGVALSQLGERVRIDIAYGGSCTAGKREDFDQYHAVLAWAAGQGLRVAPHVSLYLQFGTEAVRQYCVERGYLSAFEAVGAEILHAACGACANCGPGASTAASQVTVSAINRNFPGRSGPGQVWLASPPTVAASAIAGELVSFDQLRATVMALPNSAARARPRTVAPLLSCDAHLHIYEPGFAHQGDFVEDAGVAHYRLVQALLGTRRAVVVQPRIYGTDNTVTLNAISALGKVRTRGVAVVAPDVGDAELLRLNEGGIRGIRFSLHAPNGRSGGFDAVEPLAPRVQELGWHLQLHWTADQIVQHQALLERLPAPMVFDHLARLPLPGGTSHPAFDIVRRLLQSGQAWLKMSGPYLDTREGPHGYHDVDCVARAWLEAAPSRLVWGSDWPHVTEPVTKPDDAELLDVLARWCGDDDLLERILVGNPARLYGFENE